MGNGWDYRASTEDKAARIAELRGQGYKQKQISEILNLSPETVRRYIRVSGHNNDDRVRWTDRETETLKEMLRDGDSLDDVARVLGRSWESVYDKARRMGFLEFRRNRWTDEAKLEFMEMYAEGVNLATIAKRYGMTKKSVVAYVRQFNAENVLGNTYHVGDYGDLPPLTDYPKWPRCQCGYCPMFTSVEFVCEKGIIGTCKLLNQEMQRSDFCIADEKPEQCKYYWVIAADQLVRVAIR